MLRLALLALFVIAKSSAEDADEEGILVLNKENFEQFTTENEFAFVLFYDPENEDCQALEPEFAKVAEELKLDEVTSTIRLGKVDGTVEKELAEQFSVETYPTMTFFLDGKPSNYRGPNEAERLVKWLTRKSALPARELKTLEEVDGWKVKDDVVIVGFFKNFKSPAAKEFLNVARAKQRTYIGITSDSAAFSAYDVPDDVEKIILFKKFDEGREDFDGEITEHEIHAFIDTNMLPHVIEFTKENASKVSRSRVFNHLVVFLDQKDYKDYIKGLTPIAKEFKGQALFIYLDATLESSAMYLDAFGLKPEDAPTIRLIDVINGKSKYKPEFTGLDGDLRKFVQDFLDGSVKPYLYTADLPENWEEEPVKVLAGKNFKKVAQNETKSVLVHFYVPECEECEQLAAIWEELAAAYEDKENIVIAKMDLQANQITQVDIQTFPTIKFFPADSEEIIDYTGERTLEALKEYLNTNVKEEPEEDKRDEEAPKDEL